MRMYVVPFLWVADKYLRYNPFFTCYGKIPLLHQTEIVAKSMFSFQYISIKNSFRSSRLFSSSIFLFVSVVLFVL